MPSPYRTRSTTHSSRAAKPSKSKFEPLQRETTYACVVCRKEYEDAKDYAKHLAENHRRETPDGRFACVFHGCKSTVTSPHNLRPHYQSQHIRAAPYQCPNTVQIIHPQRPGEVITMQCVVRMDDAANMHHHKERHLPPTFRERRNKTHPYHKKTSNAARLYEPLTKERYIKSIRGIKNGELKEELVALFERRLAQLMGEKPDFVPDSSSIPRPPLDTAAPTQVDHTCGPFGPLCEVFVNGRAMTSDANSSALAVPHSTFTDHSAGAGSSSYDLIDPALTGHPSIGLHRPPGCGVKHTHVIGTPFLTSARNSSPQSSDRSWAPSYPVGGVRSMFPAYPDATFSRTLSPAPSISSLVSAQSNPPADDVPSVASPIYWSSEPLPHYDPENIHPPSFADYTCPPCFL